MAVQIPRLTRIDSSNRMPRNARIRAEIPDESGDLLKQSTKMAELTSGTIEIGMELHRKYEDKKIQELGQVNELEYNKWYEQKSQELENITEGDPTKAYAEFEKEDQEKYEEILASHTDVSGRVKRGLAGKLDRVRAGYHIQLRKQRGAQVKTYENSLFENTLKLKTNQLSNSVTDVRPNEQGVFDEYIKDIKTTIATKGESTGAVTVLPKDAKSWNYKYIGNDGEEVKIKWNPLGEARLKKELNEGISTAINNAIDADQKDQAMLVYNKYKEHLTPKASAAFLKKVESKGVKDEAYRVVANIEAKDKDEQLN